MDASSRPPKLIGLISVTLVLGSVAAVPALPPGAPVPNSLQFRDSVLFPTTGDVNDVAVGDLNNDGLNDIVSPHDVLLGKGHGTFQPAKPTTFKQDLAGEIVLADFNRDGNLDAAITIASSDQSFTNKVAILLGTGDGTFQPERDYKATNYPKALATADFNGDGVPDLLVGGDPSVDQSSSFVVLLGNGDGTFGGPIQGGEFASSLAAADLNGDGKADVVLANVAKRQVSIYFGNGDGTFQSPRNRRLDFPLFELKLVDVDGDSHPDLVACAYIENQFIVLPGRANGTFGPAITTELADIAGDFVAGDFNADGKVDFALSETDPFFKSGQTALVVLLGKGNGSFQAPITYGSIGYFLATGDLGDAALDLVGGGLGDRKSVQVAYGLGNGKFIDRHDFAVGHGAWSAATADLNHDGNLDLAIGTSDTFVGSNTVTVLLGTGRGAFAAPLSYPVAGDYESMNVAIGDLDGDGNSDLVANHVHFPKFSVAVLLGNGDGTFAPYVDYPAGVYPGWVTIADVNNDGRPDIITADNIYPGRPGAVGILLGNGDGTVQTYKEYETGDSPTFLLAADFNGDGNVDLATANGYYPYLPLTISILLGHGDGTYPKHVEYGLGNLYEFKMVTGDFNGDGKVDLACSNGNLLMGQGDGRFQFGTSFSSIDGTSITDGDYNRDGKVDLVSAIDLGHILYFTGNGDGTFAQEAPLAVGDTPYFIISGDFNRDHFLDVVTANFGLRNVSLLLNTGANQ